ncbi:DNA-directed RNA polymerase subunit D [Nanoarchaeota archaeon]
MKINLIEKTKDKSIIELDNVGFSFANVLRKNVISKVPTMAIEEVEIRDNSSVLYDEILAHRLGLIPLKTDLKSYNLPENCSCKGEGCAQCQLKLKLTAKGPGIVTASKIKSDDPKVVPVDEKMLIAKLLKDQRIQFIAKAQLGKGKDHAKWSPGHIYYKYKPIIEIKKDPKNPEAIAEVCPVDVFDVKGGKLKINKDNLLKCHLCNACVDASDKNIITNESEDSIILYVEPWGQLSVKEMLSKAVDIYMNDIDELGELIK